MASTQTCQNICQYVSSSANATGGFGSDATVMHTYIRACLVLLGHLTEQLVCCAYVLRLVTGEALCYVCYGSVIQILVWSADATWLCLIQLNLHIVVS